MGDEAGLKELVEAHQLIGLTRQAVTGGASLFACQNIRYFGAKKSEHAACCLLQI